jgi:hypothetical protein
VDTEDDFTLPENDDSGDENDNAHSLKLPSRAIHNPS